MFLDNDGLVGLDSGIRQAKTEQKSLFLLGIILVELLAAEAPFSTGMLIVERTNLLNFMQKKLSRLESATKSFVLGLLGMSQSSFSIQQILDHPWFEAQPRPCSPGEMPKIGAPCKAPIRVQGLGFTKVQNSPFSSGKNFGFSFISSSRATRMI